MLRLQINCPKWSGVYFQNYHGLYDIINDGVHGTDGGMLMDHMYCCAINKIFQEETINWYFW